MSEQWLSAMPPQPDSQAEANSWIPSFTSEAKATIQSRGVVNPAGLTNWLLSVLRGIHLSDPADSPRAERAPFKHIKPLACHVGTLQVPGSYKPTFSQAQGSAALEA